MEDLSDELVKWLLPHEGYLYKYKCTEEAQPLRTLWHCTESGCKGQVVAVSVRSKRWSRHRKLIFVPGDPNCLSMTVIKWHRHNHKANVSAVHAKRRPRTAGEHCFFPMAVQHRYMSVVVSPPNEICFFFLDTYDVIKTIMFHLMNRRYVSRKSVSSLFGHFFFGLCFSFYNYFPC
jgi:hypothetical protein